MNSLIMMTALFRTENIYAIANSIEYALEFNKKYIENIPIMWTICVDRYNAHPGIEEAAKWLENKFKNKIILMITYSGKEGQNNYGGDMFNIPMKRSVDYIESIFDKEINKWIYILDDDNIIHPYIFRAFSMIVSNKESEHFSTIWVTKVRRTGMVDSPYTEFVKENINNCKRIPSNYCPDPSQIIFNFDKIIKTYGYITSGSNYDYTWYLNVVSVELNAGRVIMSNESFITYDKNDSPLWNGDKIMASHNALRELDDIDDNQNDSEVMYINISKDLFKESKTYFILNEEIRNKIKELIKDEIIKLHQK